MARFFGKPKSTEETGSSEGVATANGDAFQPEPAKAAKWFERAKHTADTRNYEYALNCYLQGIKFDPSNLDAHQALFNVAGIFKSTGGKAASGKELREMAAGKRAVDKLAAAELAWVKDAMNPTLAAKFTRAAAELNLTEVAYWSGDLGARAVMRSKKPTKNALIQFVDIFEEIGAPDLAVQYGRLAYQMDPSDGQLDARIRNLSAQAALNKGRYDEAVGEEGGFRNSVKDLDKQTELSEDESMALGAEAQIRRLGRSKSNWEDDPEDQNTIARYADLLRKESTNESDKEAIRVLLDGFKRTQQYRFRMMAGDTKLGMERRKLRAMKEKAEASGNAEDLQKIKALDRKLKDAEVVEFAERIDKYPTDLRLKFEYGKRLFDLERYDEAIPALQMAIDDARNKATASHLIGLCFLNQEWFEEAIDSLRVAIEAYELKDDDTHLGMRFDLMVALAKHAEDQRELDAADEAFTLARGIAMKKLNFRDIKEWRDNLRALCKDLKS